MEPLGPDAALPPEAEDLVRATGALAGVVEARLAPASASAAEGFSDDELPPAGLPLGTEGHRVGSAGIWPIASGAWRLMVRFAPGPVDPVTEDAIRALVRLATPPPPHRESHALLEAAERVARYGSWSLDLDTLALRWSQECFRMLGRSPGLGPPSLLELRRLVPTSDWRQLVAGYQRARTRGRGFELEHRIRDRRRETRWVRSAAKVVLDGDLRPCRLIGSVRDVTEERTREEERRAHAAELEAARARAEAGERAKSDFLATMSHEMRTPLNGVLASTSLLAEQALDEGQLELVATIQASGEALLTLIDDILDFSQLERGRVELVRRAFCLHDVVEDALAIVAEAAREKRLLLGYELADGADRVEGDRNRIRQILVNLLGNAVKFTDAGEVRVRVERAVDAPDFVVFSVQDTGIGIDPEQLGRIFEPFIQGDASYRRRHGGTGLGLVVVRRLAEAMDGRSWAESVVGRGSTFFVRVRLPPAPHARAIAPLRRTRVAIELSDPRTRSLMERHLEALGATLDPGSPIVVRELDPDASPSGPPGQIGLRPVGSRAGGAWVEVAHPVRWASLTRAVARARAFVLEAGLDGRDADLAETEPSRLPSVAAELEAPRGPVLDVLVAEDNPVNQKILRRILDRLGHRVTVVSDGRAALEQVRAGSYDLVLMDLQMPVMDGLEATRRLRAEGHALPVWAVTANALPSDRAACQEAGMDDFVAKPVRLEDLAERLGRWAASRG